MKRVVVTGMGCITPVGNDIPTFWSSIVAGKNGIGPIARFDTTDFKAKLAAEVKDFDPNLYMEKAEIRKSDLFAQYGMAAAYQAVQDSGILGKVEPERLGVYVGSGIGGIITFTEEVIKLHDKGPRRVSPLFIPTMIANMAA
ncbi:MAG: beta-ketoacyl-[Spirochaetales bacterium]|nr:beta-ketoacyl-[acyl-carrier-protein] synthase II [Spirochaetales bacterium]